MEHTLSAGFALLRFPASLEQDFLRSHAADRTVKLVLAGCVAVMVFGGLSLTDRMVAPDQTHLALSLRFGVFAPITLTMLWLLHRFSRPQLNEWFVVPIALSAAAITCVLALAFGPDVAFTKIIELMIIVIYVGVFTRFWPMVTLCVPMLILHTAVIVVMPEIVLALRLGSSFLLITTIVFGLYACYVREHNERTSYLLDLREAAMRQSIQDGNQALRDMARTDALTGIPNRRAFDDALTQHLSHDNALGLTLMMVDVDHFKAYNDHYGHQAGDRCLREVTDAIATCLRRPVDLLARWGGEEFVLILNEGNADVARQVASRICTTVAERSIAHAKSRCASHVTVSIGVVMLPALAPCATEPPQQAQRLLQAADAALYRAKAQGRNRFELEALPC